MSSPTEKPASPQTSTSSALHALSTTRRSGWACDDYEGESVPMVVDGRNTTWRDHVDADSSLNQEQKAMLHSIDRALSRYRFQGIRWTPLRRLMQLIMWPVKLVHVCCVAVIGASKL
ncbi:hypothetical protein MMC06_000910 [Schaereria dolodes]|nr:hypothetical protein [Schaereria dolodes]